jgi:Lsr2
MATITTTNLIDDLDGTEADVTVSLVVDSGKYTVDLSQANYEEYVLPLLNVGRSSVARRRRGSRPTPGRKAKSGSSKRSLTAFSKLAKDDQVAIRRYLKKSRGRVTDTEVSAWKADRKR